MAVYMALAGYNIYKMMFPLAGMDLSNVQASQMVHPLWDEGTVMDMRVFLSTRQRFNVDFLQTEFPVVEEVNNDNNNDTNETAVRQPKPPPKDVALLWKQELRAPSLSKSFLITSLSETTTNDNDNLETCPSSEDASSCQASNNNYGNMENDDSFQAAKSWLDQAERTAFERGEGGVLSAINAARQGIESTSFLLTLYYAASKQMQKLLALVSLAPPVIEDEDHEAKALDELKLDRTIIHLPPNSPLWNALKSNSTFYLHVMVLRQYPKSGWEGLWPPQSVGGATKAVHMASRGHALLLGQVNMVKFEAPHHISKPKRILYRDVSYLIRKYVLRSTSDEEQPPWDFSYSKPRDHAIYESYLEMKERGAGYPYWKPEVSIKYVKDEQSYPESVAGYSGMQLVRLPRPSADHPTGIAHLPALYSSEIGLTSDKFIPVNETVTTLPLRVSFDRSDVHDTDDNADDKEKQYRQSKVTTATAGAISPARWRLLSHLTEALEAQKSLGFEQSDIDEVRLSHSATYFIVLACCSSPFASLTNHCCCNSHHLHIKITRSNRLSPTQT